MSRLVRASYSEYNKQVWNECEKIELSKIDGIIVGGKTYSNGDFIIADNSSYGDRNVDFLIPPTDGVSPNLIHPYDNINDKTYNYLNYDYGTQTVHIYEHINGKDEEESSIDVSVSEWLNDPEQCAMRCFETIIDSSAWDE